MPPRSARAESARRGVSPLQTVHPGYYSLHGAAVVPADAPNAPARSGERPTYPADVAQSRLFQALLLDELDELEDLVAATERRRRRRREENPDDSVAVPHALLQLRERIKEARRLLDALHERFPRD
ncbi:MAG: hypothetical protein QOD90_2883 [Mycobacterium sp.]|nr:hypothetical protein [Mycobacterium sp.]